MILVLNKEEDKVLMCYRSKNPYKGKYNLVGGKIEKNEDFRESAYRELFEETGITKEYINLLPFIDFHWHPFSMKMIVFIGKVEKEINLIEEIHKLSWIDINENFFDTKRFAGEGNIGHMINIYKNNQKEIFKD